jgi:predicted ATP-grasp superfamily ATP-dependent carboligase
MFPEEEKLLKRLDTSQPLAVILGCERAHGLAFVRSLGRKGIPVIAVDSNPGPGMHSRFARNCVAPAAPDDTALLRFLERLGENLPEKGVMIAADDAHVLFLSKHRNTLSRYFNFVLTEESDLLRLADKKYQYEHAASIGIPVPKTYALDDSVPIESLAQRVEYPCILKPVYSHLWAHYRRQTGILNAPKVALAASPSELVSAYDQMAQSGVGMVVQEIIEGSDDRLYALYTYLNRESEPLAVFVRQKLRQWPPRFGTGTHSVSVSEPAVVEQGLKLLQSVGYRGLANIEFKKDPKDGCFKLIEINLRGAIQIALAVDSSVDIPHIAYRDISGEAVDPVTSYREGVRWIDFGTDVRAFLHCYRTGHIGFWQWLRSISASKSRAYFAWDDPMPSLAQFYYWGRTRTNLLFTTT